MLKLYHCQFLSGVYEDMAIKCLPPRRLEIYGIYTIPKSIYLLGGIDIIIYSSVSCYIEYALHVMFTAPTINTITFMNYSL